MRRIFLGIILLIVIGICYFYYSISIGFGNAALETSKAIYEIKESIEKDTIKSIDSTKIKTIKAIDSSDIKNQ